MYPAPLRRGLPFLAYGNQLFFRSETVWVLGGQRSTPPGTTIAAYMTSRPDLGERWPSRLVATAASANCLTLNRLAIDTFRQVLMVGEWGTLLPVLRCPARQCRVENVSGFVRLPCEGASLQFSQQPLRFLLR